MNHTIIAYYKGTRDENPKSRWLDHLICLVTRSRFSHLEIVYEYDPDSRTGWCYSSSPRDGGVRTKEIDFTTGHWELYQVPCDNTTDEILSFFRKKDGMRYDVIGAIGAAFPIFKHNPNRMFCSEIVAECLGHGNPWKYTPQDLYKYYRSVHKRVL